MQNPLQDPVQKFCKTFTHNIKQFQLRRGDDDLPFDDWECLYPNLSVDLNRVKEGSKIITTTVKSLDQSETDGGADGDETVDKTEPIRQKKKGKEPQSLTLEEAEDLRPEQKHKKRRDEAESKTCYANREENNSYDDFNDSTGSDNDDVDFF